MRPEDGTPPVRLRTELRKESKLLSPAIPRQTSERGVIVSKNGLPRKPLTKRRLKNLILNVLKNPFNMVVLVSLIILFCLIIIPLLTMISSTFTLAQGELRRVQGHVGDFTLYYWKYILTGKHGQRRAVGAAEELLYLRLLHRAGVRTSGLRAGLADDPHGSSPARRSWACW